MKRINITFVNPNPMAREYYITGTNERGRKFSYGLRLETQGRQAEYLPIGTQVYRKGKLIATLKSEDDKRDVKL